MADTDYSKSLEEEARDLVQAARDGALPGVHFREGLADEVLEYLVLPQQEAA